MLSVHTELLKLLRLLYHTSPQILICKDLQDFLKVKVLQWCKMLVSLHSLDCVLKLLNGVLSIHWKNYSCSSTKYQIKNVFLVFFFFSWNVVIVSYHLGSMEIKWNHKQCQSKSIAWCPIYSLALTQISIGKRLFGKYFLDLPAWGIKFENLISGHVAWRKVYP